MNEKQIDADSPRFETESLGPKQCKLERVWDEKAKVCRCEAGTWGPEAVNNLLSSLPGPHR